MAAQQLFGDGFDHAAEVERALLLRHAGVERHLEQQIAELLAQIVEVAARNRVGDLIGLFECVGRNGREILFDIPRTAGAGRAQRRHDFQKPCDVARRFHRRVLFYWLPLSTISANRIEVEAVPGLDCESSKEQSREVRHEQCQATGPFGLSDCNRTACFQRTDCGSSFVADLRDQQRRRQHPCGRPATHKVVSTIEGIEAAHGVAFSPDGTRVYASNEADHTVDVFDQKTGKLIKKVALSGRPNNLAVAKDGRIVVAIAQEPGALDIIDPVKLERKVSILTNGRLHNTYVTPDSRFAIMGSTRTNIFTVIDLQKEEIAWELNLGKGVRPMTMETNPDGSTKRVFMQLSDLNGFAIVDFASRQMVGKIELPKAQASMSSIIG